MSAIERALISVSDKDGLVEFARGLQELHVEIISTGGSAKLLRANGVKVVEIADYTGFPELLAGRLKTLHPKIHGGILGRRESPSDLQALRDHAIPFIDIVVVNLYPFEETAARPATTLSEAIENIDIGGPTLLRAAAKNYTAVTVLVDHNDYAPILEEIRRNNGAVTAERRFQLASKAFEHTAAYEDAIANYLGTFRDEVRREAFPRTYNKQFRHTTKLRYGENPHQNAAFYAERDPPDACIATARQVQGKELSFNNIADSDAALECVKSFEEAACVIVKHANPCGAAIADDILEAYRHAYITDPTSAFGGIIAFNRPLDGATAKEILERQFVEVLIAPSIEPAARTILAGKPNVRVLESGAWSGRPSNEWDIRSVTGGVLVQERDNAVVGPSDLKVVTRRQPNRREMRDLLFAWKVVKFVKSNAIVYCKEGRTIGVGAGQMSRVYSARIASIKATDAGLEVRGSVMASDAFFPFRDGLDQAAEAGVTAVIQPGGSMRDQEVIAAANEHDIAMVFTGVRHFRH